jgi:inner membrane protein
MDTGTHFIMGVGLYGLAHLDPTITQNADMLFATLLGTVIGSQIPDIDTLYRIKGNAAYVRNHRGWTHSLPVLLIWPTIITLVISLFVTLSSPLSLWLWTSLAVLIHVFIDCFNTYGTQALKPLNNKWISLNIINIFDPVIFALHIVGILLCFIIQGYSGVIFAFIYGLLICYIAWRTAVHYNVTKWAMDQVGGVGRYTVTPTYRLRMWNLILELEDQVKIGEIRNQTIEWTGFISRSDENHPATKRSKESTAISSFLYFTSYGYPQVQEREAGYEVKWLDVRYYHKKQFPFIAMALLDHNYKITHSFVGWLSEKQVQKKAEHITK